MRKKPSILVCNDDGITAPGLAALVEVMRGLGEVTLVAPDSPQSAMGHAITMGEPLRLDEIEFHRGFRAWQCNGTPADCVKLATKIVLKHKPDLLVSGINHGSNSSINVIYSGTMSAAVEGAIEGIPSIGISFCNYSLQADLSLAKKYSRLIAKAALKNKIPQGALLNVNIPNVSEKELKGIKITRQAIAKWVEEFDVRSDPRGRKYYWLTGKFENHDKGEDTDEYALHHNYISICPVQFDLTAHFAIPILNGWEFEE